MNCDLDRPQADEGFCCTSLFQFKFTILAGFVCFAYLISTVGIIIKDIVNVNHSEDQMVLSMMVVAMIIMSFASFKSQYFAFPILVHSIVSCLYYLYKAAQDRLIFDVPYAITEGCLVILNAAQDNISHSLSPESLKCYELMRNKKCYPNPSPLFDFAFYCFLTFVFIYSYIEINEWHKKEPTARRPAA